MIDVLLFTAVVYCIQEGTRCIQVDYRIELELDESETCITATIIEFKISFIIINEYQASIYVYSFQM